VLASHPQRIARVAAFLIRPGPESENTGLTHLKNSGGMLAIISINCSQTDFGKALAADYSLSQPRAVDM